MNNKNGSSLIEIIVAFSIIAIISVSIITNMNVFANLIVRADEKKVALDKLIAAVYEFEMDENEIEFSDYTASVNFNLDGEDFEIPVRYKRYQTKSQPQKKLVAFLRY